MSKVSETIKEISETLHSKGAFSRHNIAELAKVVDCLHKLKPTDIGESLSKSYKWYHDNYK